LIKRLERLYKYCICKKLVKIATLFRRGFMPKKDQARLTKVSVNLPFGIGGAEWTPDNTERNAAWSLYVELVTRISVQTLKEDQGLLREALTSLYSLFGTTREILRNAGPDVGASKNSVGGIAIAVLNNGLRPILAYWHPELLDWESKRKPEISPRDHEMNWKRNKELCDKLEALQKDLTIYADALAEIAGIDK
jgi:hypothetical protein